jgi:hypothetical protein
MHAVCLMASRMAGGSIPAHADTMNTDAQGKQSADPREAGPRPDYPQQPVAPPGHEEELTPRADHGEQSYVGAGRLN